MTSEELAALAGPFTEQRMHDFIEKAKWVFAKTMPEHPHEYHQQHGSPNAQTAFQQFGEYIQEFGSEFEFNKRRYHGFQHGDHVYFVLDWKLDLPHTLEKPVKIIARRAIKDGNWA